MNQQNFSDDEEEVLNFSDTPSDSAFADDIAFIADVLKNRPFTDDNFSEFIEWLRNNLPEIQQKYPLNRPIKKLFATPVRIAKVKRVRNAVLEIESRLNLPKDLENTQKKTWLFKKALLRNEKKWTIWDGKFIIICANFLTRLLKPSKIQRHYTGQF